MEDDTTMSQEDQRNCDGRGIGGVGRSSKKSKQKKVPQRGLGVAQLEKIRLEEQQKRDGASILPSPSTLSSTKPSYLSLPIQNFHDSNQSPSTTTLLPCEPPSDFGSPLSQQHMDANAKVPSTVPLANSGGFEAGWPGFPGHGNVPKWWSAYQFDSDKNNFGVEPGLPILPSLPFDSNPIWPLPNLVQKTPQYQRQSSSSVVNVSSGTSSTSMPHFSIEPPSNQNNNGSSVPVRPMEKMVGMKRPYPFSLEFPHAPAFNYKLSPFAEIRTNVKASCGNGSGFNFDAGNSTSREVSSCSASNSEPNSMKRNEENDNFNGDFLTLGPPSPPQPSKAKLSSTFLALHNQGNVEDQIPTPPVYRLFNQQKQPFYGFFLPEPKEEQVGQTAARIQNGHEVGESVDLNLKL